MTWLTDGWQVFGRDRAVAAWVATARAPALAAVRDPANAHWLRHGRTWFVGVDALDNDAAGKVGNGPPLSGCAFEAAVAATSVRALHRAQISVTYPGYPGRDPGDNAASHRYRVARDAAHLDGLLPEGPHRRRHLRELHAWILGLPLTKADAGAAPLVVWAGSHEIIRGAFAAAFDGLEPGEWGDLDVTDIYQTARADVFGSCPRIEVPLQVGEAVLLHRMVIHGVAPWQSDATSAPEGRAIAYFRPCFSDPARWLAAP